MADMIHIINSARAAGVIDNAPSVAQILLNILNFLLQVFGIIAIIALVVSGIIYLTAYGSEDKLKTARKSATYSVIGIVLVLAGMVIIRTISKFF